MKNDVMTKPFPVNLLEDLGATNTTTQADDFIGTLMYILRTNCTARDSKALLMRYQNGKKFEEIGESLGVTKQRANAMVNDILAQFTSEHVEMLEKGLKRYMEDVFADRIADFKNVLEESEREELRIKAYNDGYEKGYADGGKMLDKNPANKEAINNIGVETLGLSVRTYNACIRNNLKTIGDILECGDSITECITLGRVSFRELMRTLGKFGINPSISFPRATMELGLGA